MKHVLAAVQSVKETIRPGGLSKGNVRPADLFHGIPIDARAHGLRDKLCAKAYPQYRGSPPDRAPQNVDLSVNIVQIVVDGHRSAHKNQACRFLIGRWPPGGEIHIFVLDCGRLKGGRDAPEMLVRNVAKCKDAHSAICLKPARLQNG